MEDNYLIKNSIIYGKLRNLDKELDFIKNSIHKSLVEIKKENIETFQRFDIEKKKFQNCNIF